MDFFARTEPIFTIMTSFIAVLLTIYIHRTTTKHQERMKMEGNILETKEYKNTFFADMQKYADVDNRNELYKRIRNSLVMGFNAKTAIDFTDSIQRTMDSLLWIAWLKHFDEESDNNSFCVLITDIHDKVMEGYGQYKLKGINGRWDKTIEANINLISAVLCYLEPSINPNKKAIREIEKVNGALLINNTNRFIYYNSRGLICLNTAGEKISQSFNIRTRIWENLAKCNPLHYENDNDEVKALVSRASDSFASAEESIEDDVFLKSFLLFNQSRVLLLECFIKKTSDKESTHKKAEEALEVRKNVKSLMCCILDNNFMMKCIDEEIGYAERFLNCLSAKEND